MENIQTKNSELVQRVGMCSRTADGFVHYQNEASQTICGNKVGTPCNGDCIPFYRMLKETNRLHEHSTLLEKCKVGDGYFDILFFKRDGQDLTMLMPLAGSPSEDLKALEVVGLTRRELEIAKLALAGHQNESLIRMLNISRSTLRCHLNQIYRKIGPRARDIFRRLQVGENSKIETND